MFRILKLVSRFTEALIRLLSSRIVQERAQGSIVQTAGYWVQQRVECGRVCYALHRERLDVFCSEKAKLDTINGRGCWLMGVHSDACWTVAPILQSNPRAKAIEGLRS